jgi:glycosyl hydrolase family 30
MGAGEAPCHGEGPVLRARHVSKFLQQGAVRIESNTPANLGNVAFRNPDESIILVVLNDTDAGQTAFTVHTGAASFSATLPAGAVATFIQPAEHAADTDPPSTPSDLASTAKTSTNVSLSWTASTDNVGVTGYDLYNGATNAATVTDTSATVPDLSMAPPASTRMTWSAS